MIEILFRKEKYELNLMFLSIIDSYMSGISIDKRMNEIACLNFIPNNLKYTFFLLLDSIESLFEIFAKSSHLFSRTNIVLNFWLRGCFNSIVAFKGGTRPVSMPLALNICSIAMR